MNIIIKLTDFSPWTDSLTKMRYCNTAGEQTTAVQCIPTSIIMFLIVLVPMLNVLLNWGGGMHIVHYLKKKRKKIFSYSIQNTCIFQMTLHGSTAIQSQKIPAMVSVLTVIVLSY